MKKIIFTILILFCLSCKKEKTDNTSKLLGVLAIANSTKVKSYTVTTLAGSGSQGSTNGTGTAASFNNPRGVAVDSSGNVFVADTMSNKIRKITPAGVVTTFAGSGSDGSTNGTGTAASFNYPCGIVIDNSGIIYVSDISGGRIRKITSTGVVTTIAGAGYPYGSADGIGTAATFYLPWGLSIDASGNLFVADSANNKIRKITTDGTVSTFAGSGTASSMDGTGTAASFNNPIGMVMSSNGIIYVGDTWNNKIRKITTDGVVTTFAGSGSQSSIDGTGTAASFNYPTGLVMDSSGSIYVSDNENKIRKITTEGVVTTLAGSGSASSIDGIGTSASFNKPRGIAIDSSGNFYVADSGSHKIRKITFQ